MLAKEESKNFNKFDRFKDQEVNDERDRHKNIYNEDVEYSYRIQELGSNENFDEVNKFQPKREFDRKVANSSSDYEKIIDSRIQRIIMSHKKTQTPVRAVANEAIQYDSDEWAQTKSNLEYAKHASKTPSNIGKRGKIDEEEEKLPFSTIKKYILYLLII